MVVIDLVVGIAVASLLMSFIEHQAHARLMHTKQIANIIPALTKVFRSHAIEHHGTYSRSFTDEPQGPGEDRGIRLNHKEGFIESLFAVPVLWLISPYAAISFVFIVQIHHYIWNEIHLEMHKPVQRYFSTWAPYRWVVRHHMLHHKYPTKNFNVVFPLCDFLLGTVYKPTYKDIAEFYRLGLLPGQSKVFDGTQLQIASKPASKPQSTQASQPVPATQRVTVGTRIR